MSDRLQRISENAGRIMAATVVPAEKREQTVALSPATCVALAIEIEQEVMKQTLAAFAPSRPCTCEEVPGDHARCPIHGEP